jgi:hypothetical protein
MSQQRMTSLSGVSSRTYGATVTSRGRRSSSQRGFVSHTSLDVAILGPDEYG